MAVLTYSYCAKGQPCPVITDLNMDPSLHQAQSGHACNAITLKCDARALGEAAPKIVGSSRYLRSGASAQFWQSSQIELCSACMLEP